MTIPLPDPDLITPIEFCCDGRFYSAETLIEFANARAAEALQQSVWLRVVDEARVCCHIGTAEATDSYEVAKAKLNDLTAWHEAAALDPAISEDAQKLKEVARREALEEAAKVCESHYNHEAKDCAEEIRELKGTT
jgi:autonomous glycyl radical cofactor GrcA